MAMFYCERCRKFEDADVVGYVVGAEGENLCADASTEEEAGDVPANEVPVTADVVAVEEDSQ